MKNSFPFHHSIRVGSASLSYDHHFPMVFLSTRIIKKKKLTDIIIYFYNMKGTLYIVRCVCLYTEGSILFFFFFLFRFEFSCLTERAAADRLMTRRESLVRSKCLNSSSFSLAVWDMKAECGTNQTYQHLSYQLKFIYRDAIEGRDPKKNKIKLMLTGVIPRCHRRESFHTCIL
jgi:hypothetical protein